MQQAATDVQPTGTSIQESARLASTVFNGSFKLVDLHIGQLKNEKTHAKSLDILNLFYPNNHLCCSCEEIKNYRMQPIILRIFRFSLKYPRTSAF